MIIHDLRTVQKHKRSFSSTCNVYDQARNRSLRVFEAIVHPRKEALCVLWNHPYGEPLDESHWDDRCSPSLRALRVDHRGLSRHLHQVINIPVGAVPLSSPAEDVYDHVFDLGRTV